MKENLPAVVDDRSDSASSSVTTRRRGAGIPTRAPRGPPSTSSESKLKPVSGSGMYYVVCTCVRVCMYVCVP